MGLYDCLQGRRARHHLNKQDEVLGPEMEENQEILQESLVARSCRNFGTENKPRSETFH